MNFPRQVLSLAVVFNFLHLDEAVDEGVSSPQSASRRLEMFLRKIILSQTRTIINTLKRKEAPEDVLTKIIKDPRIYFCRCKKPLSSCFYKIDKRNAKRHTAGPNSSSPEGYEKT